MKKQEAFEMSGGTTIRKSPIEHFTPTQFMYGSPYSYIIEYADYAGGSPEKRYGLWQFNDATLKYALFQTGGDKDYNVLSDIAASWENTLREAHHIKNLQTMPRSFWSDDDKAKYPDLETIDDSDGGPNQKPKPKKAVKKPVKKAHSLAIMALFGLFGLIQCTSVINRNLTDDSHSSAKTLDWNGTYKSMTPDDNYSGTVTEITLDTAQKYTIKKTYLDKGAQPARGTEQSGNFSWNKSGNTITLLGIDNQPNTFFVGENRLWELDKKGRKITGSDADKYILNKHYEK